MISFSLIFTDQTLLFVFIIDSSLVADSKFLGCIFQFLAQQLVNLKKKLTSHFFISTRCLWLNHVIFCLFEPIIKWACLHPLLLCGGEMWSTCCWSSLCCVRLNDQILLRRLTSSV